jgi:hypothetical protein
VASISCCSADRSRCDVGRAIEGFVIPERFVPGRRPPRIRQRRRLPSRATGIASRSASGQGNVAPGSCVMAGAWGCFSVFSRALPPDGLHQRWLGRLDRRGRAPPSSSVLPCPGSVAAPPSASRRSATASPRDFRSNPAAEPPTNKFEVAAAQRACQLFGGPRR